MLWLRQNNILTRNIIVPKNNDVLKDIYDLVSDKPMCKQIILESDKSVKQQVDNKINLYIFSNCINNDLTLIEDLFINTTPYGFKNFMENKFHDFYFFATQILNNITIEQIEYYDINELIYIKRICKKLDHQQSYTNVLENINSGAKNEKVLSLANKISLNKTIINV